MAKPDISRLLVDSALRPELLRRLAEAPESVFEEYALSPEQRELLRQPDHRLLALLGAALQATGQPAAPIAPDAPAPVAIVESKLLPDTRLALTVVPCLVGDRIAFATWIAPLHEGGDPSRIPPPPGSTLPGTPLAPLHAVIQITSALSKDAAGSPQVSMWASLRQSTNAPAPPPPETAGNPALSPFGSRLDSPEIQTAAAAARTAPAEQRYEKLVALLHALRGGELR